MSAPDKNTPHSLDGLLFDLLREFVVVRAQTWPADLLALARRNAEKAVIRLALECHGFNVSQAARRLGIARKTLYSKIRQHGINAGQFAGKAGAGVADKPGSSAHKKADKARPIHALVSVSDKSGLSGLCRSLGRCGVRILATGGTARALDMAGIEHGTVEDLTAMAEMMDGRVKTLHPNIFAPILARLPQDQRELDKYSLPAIDIVIVNLYPFARVVAGGSATAAQARENIDIGGVALLRAGAKNYTRVSTLCHPDQYGELIDILESGREPGEAERRRWAQAAFAHTCAYDRDIEAWLGQSNADTDTEQEVGEHGHILPEQYRLDLPLVEELRYGENPHQSARLYREPQSPEPWQQLQGRQASYNNLVDSDCATRLVRRLSTPACVIVKHDTPCAVACGRDALDSFQRAFATDTESPFGGIIAFNCPVDERVAEEITGRVFTEIVIAPEFNPASLGVFAKKKKLRIFACQSARTAKNGVDIRRVLSGYLVQETMDTQAELTQAGKFASADALADLRLAWQVVAFARSNAIVAVCAGRTTGICGGATSRVRAVRGALESAKSFCQGNECTDAPLVMASDAFFPFRDSVDHAAAAGVKAIVHPGGSIRDKEVIASADEHGIAIYTTGKRVFRH